MSSTTRPTITLLSLLVAGIAFILPACRNTLGHGRGMAESVSNVRQIGLTLSSFAMDNDGEYPTATTADVYDLPAPKSSNDFFRQLFASGHTNSERIFWSKNSHVCSKVKPDDVITAGGKFDPAQTLRPGDNHWAYFTGLKNIDPPSIPLVLESFIPGTTTFPERKIIVLRLDGSANPNLVTPAGTILDSKGKDLLSSKSHLWSGAIPDLRQPDPAPP